MDVTIYRHNEYNKFMIIIDDGANIKKFTLYDVTLNELGDFIAGITKGEK